MNIYVANLSFDTKDDGLRDLFAPYGEVSSAKVIIDKVTNRSRGFGFVEMPDDTAGKKAIAELDGASVLDRAIKVNEAKPREDKPFGGGGRGGRDSSRGGYGGGGDRNFNNANSFNKNGY